MDAEFTPFHHGGSGPPVVLVHGFTDTWRTWELVIPELERDYEVLAVTMPGHAGGPPVPNPFTAESFADGVLAAMKQAGFDSAHLAGNSLGGWVSLQLAARGHALSVTGMAPAGGWSHEFQETYALDYFITQQELVKKAAQAAEEIAASPEGRRQATRFIVEDDRLITAQMVAQQMIGAANCPGAEPMIRLAREQGFELEAGQIDCPVRFVWGTKDKLLRWPSTAVRFQNEWLPEADYLELDGVGHCPQLEVPGEVAELISGTAKLA